MRYWTFLAVAAAFTAATSAAAEHHEDSAAATPDYALGQNWLCLPGQRDACTVSLATTRIDADGSATVEQNAVAADPGFDCFYVYPTVSNDETNNSDMVDKEEERRVTLLQAAPFQQACRVYAPLYRQVTLTALRRAMATGNFSAWLPAREIAYGDVKAAWDHYLAVHNDGRGVVLIGHSQGSAMLNQLLEEEFDGQPITDRLIAAYLIGANIAVPEGEDVGGGFDAIPLCRSADQTGCVVSFVSFRADVPPPANARFGKVEADGMAAACVNPAALAGGSAPLDAWLSNRSLITEAEPVNWAEGAEVTTAFVRAPGLLTAECVTDHGANYLAVTINGDPADPRTDDIPGDVVFAGQRLDDWGLHLIDMNLVMGDMVGLVEQQGAAWSAARD
ncbi:MAG: DUF3089 domain-containing protein [Sphingomonadaceae bacterium]|nr:DUF3089 domain-containing protein [Sphingomonadaceae bacterium]